ncbi:MAG: sulfurtransferase TusA family protein [Spirochaetes bacterium]|jgi:tRNA 2-thiouridine synthesizing protein A|nr:sulfurtransferase TusA family protein [Spirochaetota bacterium]
MENKIDARGLSCPQPVILVQKALKDGALSLEIIVDNDVSKENVIRFAEGKYSMKTSVAQDGNDILLKITK